MKRNKKSIKKGDSIIFKTGNFAGLYGVVLSVDLNSKEPKAIFGIWIEVRLSNGKIGYIEKSEHWEFIESLTLNLIAHWFGLIWDGFKTVEYRAITPLYCSKFLLWENEHRKPQWWFNYYFNQVTDECDLDNLIQDVLLNHVTFKKFNSVKFNNGMRKIMPRMELGFEGIDIGEGEEALGAEKGVYYFRIHLGELMNSANINLLKQ